MICTKFKVLVDVSFLSVFSFLSFLSFLSAWASVSLAFVRTACRNACQTCFLPECSGLEHVEELDGEQGFFLPVRYIRLRSHKVRNDGGDLFDHFL